MCAIGRDANTNKRYDLLGLYWSVTSIIHINKKCNLWGLLKTVKELVPNADNRICAKQIYDNWRKIHKHEATKEVVEVCRSTMQSVFNMYRAYLSQETLEGSKDMITTSLEHWRWAFFKIESNCDSVDSVQVSITASWRQGSIQSFLWMKP